MKGPFYTIFILFSLLLACSKDKADNPYKVDDAVLQSDQALVTNWIFNDYKPEMNPGVEFSLSSLTTAEINEHLHARVYTIVSDVPGLSERGVFIKNDSVYDLGRYNLFGANGLENLLVADLNKDNIYELYFTITHGSGILRTNVVCYINDLDDMYLMADYSFMFPLDYTIELKEGDEILNVFYKSSTKVMPIGEISLQEIDQALKCHFQLDKGLPQYVLDDITGN